MKNIVVILTLVLALSACTKQETVVPFGQQVATKIQDALSRTPVNGSVVYIGTTYMTGSASISFDGEMMIIDQHRYNLNRLVEYDIIKGQGGYGIEFYF